MTTFQKIKIGDICDLQQGLCMNRKSKHLLIDKSELPLLRITDLINNTQNQYINPSLVSPQFISNENSLIYTRTGQVGLVFKNKKGVVYNNCFKIIPKKNIDINFLFYLLKQKSLYDTVIRISSKAAQPDLTHTAFKFLSVNVPAELSIQTRIVSIISSYDDLIENNEKRIKTLEEMVQLLYNEWFVKFKFPGHEKVKMIDSGTEFGKIPENFSVDNITDFVEFMRGVEPGSTNYKTTYSSDLLPFLRVGDLGSRNSGLFIEKLVAKGKILERKDIAVTMDGTVGRVSIGMYGAYSTGIRKLIIINQKINREFLYCFMLSGYAQNLIKEHARGATILHASDSIKYMKVVLPNQEIIDLFKYKVNPMVDEILFLQDKNRILSEIRDLLIPQLVTGKRELK